MNSDGRTTSIVHEQKTIHIKPGYHAGTVLHYPKGGHETVHRTVSDLFLTITEIPHPKYQRKGDDLVYIHDFTLADALDCKSVDLLTLDNRHLNIGLD